jgi:hypothetical protein
VIASTKERAMTRSPIFALSLVWLLLPACTATAYTPSSPSSMSSPDSGPDSGIDPMPSPPRHSPVPSPPPFDPVRIAAGATAAYTDPSGHVWAADFDFTGGVTSVNASPVAIAGTDAAALYNAERYGQAGQDGGGFSYAIAVPNGAYVVHLGFAETFLQAAGQRLFAVSINGQQVLADFDIFAAAGGMNRAVVQSFPITVSTGQVALTFAAGTIQNPKVNTIEIVADLTGRR